MTLDALLALVQPVPLLLGALLYALLSRVWFAYVPWSRHYHGAFSEKFIGPRMKLRSGVIRIAAGFVMSALVGILGGLLQLITVTAYLKLGAFVSIGIAVVAVVQYVEGHKMRRAEIVTETSFQLIAIVGICVIWGFM